MEPCPGQVGAVVVSQTVTGQAQDADRHAGPLTRHQLTRTAADPGERSRFNAAARAATSRTATYNVITTYEIRGLLRRDSQGRYTLGWGQL